jgi:hypothetical protein
MSNNILDPAHLRQITINIIPLLRPFLHSNRSNRSLFRQSVLQLKGTMNFHYVIIYGMFKNVTFYLMMQHDVAQHLER